MLSILSRSWLLLMRRKRALVTGIAAVALLCVLLQVVMEQRVGTEVASQLQRLLGDQRYHEISAQLEVPHSQNDLQVLFQNVADEAAKKIDSFTPAERSAYVSTLIQESLPVAGIVVSLLAIYFLISVWIRGFFFQACLVPNGDFRELVAHATGSYLRFLGVVIVNSIASCFWLPLLTLPLLGTSLAPVFFLSILLPFFLVPRLIVSPFIVLRGGKIWRSLGESYRVTRGSFWKIVATMLISLLVSGICAGLLSAFLSMLMPTTSSTVIIFFAWIHQMISLISGAFVVIVLAVFSQDVLGKTHNVISR